MIYTITWNPSIDYIVSVKKFRVGEVNRAVSESMFPGGKGLNVSMVLKNMGVDNTAIGFIAGFTGKEIERQVKQAGVRSELIHVPCGCSRINLKLKSNQETEINGCGPEIKEKEIKDLVHDADITRADIRDEIAMQYQELKRRLEEADEVKKGLELETLGSTRNGSRQEQRFYTVPEGTGEVLDMAGFNSGINLSSEITENGLMKELDMQNSSVEDNTTEIENDVTVNNNAAEPETDKPYISLAGQENANIDNYGYKLYGNFGVTEMDKAMLETEINNTNHNDEIIELYKKGRSILEISKMLSIGQGEVKFVIDMYKAS